MKNLQRLNTILQIGRGDLSLKQFQYFLSDLVIDWSKLQDTSSYSWIFKCCCGWSSCEEVNCISTLDSSNCEYEIEFECLDLLVSISKLLIHWRVRDWSSVLSCFLKDFPNELWLVEFVAAINKCTKISNAFMMRKKHIIRYVTACQIVLMLIWEKRTRIHSQVVQIGTLKSEIRTNPQWTITNWTIRNSRKCLWLWVPIHDPTNGQWWSNRTTQALQQWSISHRVNVLFSMNQHDSTNNL